MNQFTICPDRNKDLFTTIVDLPAGQGLLQIELFQLISELQPAGVTMIKRKGKKNEEASAKVYEGESIQLMDACVRVFSF